MNKIEKKPPKTAKWLLQFLIDREIHYSCIGDIEEIYSDVLDDKGIVYAGVWFYSQVLLIITKHIIYTVSWSTSMIKNYLKIALRNLSRHKVYSTINICGLGIGLASFIILSLYVQDELGYDRFHENADRIYRVGVERPWMYMGKNREMLTSAPLAGALKNDFPEVENAVRINKSGGFLITNGDNSFFEQAVYWCDPDIFSIFTFPLLKGNPENVLNDPYSMVISEDMAEKYFGDEDPVGKVLSIKQSNIRSTQFTITGVFKNIPSNSQIRFDFAAPFDTYGFITGWDYNRWQNTTFYTYMLVKDTIEPQEFERKLNDYLPGKNIEFYGKFFLQPLTYAHLHSDAYFDIVTPSNIKYVYIFSSIAVFILAIACINYMNLSTARSIKRSKEIGIRKVSGAHRKQIVIQFLCESLLITIVALAVSVLLVSFSLNMLNDLMSKELNFDPFDNTGYFVFLFTVSILVGIFSGTYPALFVSSYKPLAALRGNFRAHLKGKNLRNSLVIVQFSISIVLIISTLVVNNQMDFIKDKDSGYVKENIVTVSVRDRNIRRNLRALKSKLMSNPEIINLSTSLNLPNYFGSAHPPDWPGRTVDLPFEIYLNHADYNYVDVFGLEIVEGRNFSEDYHSDANGAFLLNETAVKALNWDNAIGREFSTWGSRSGKVVGIIKDFHLHSVHQKIKPAYIYLNPDHNISFISIKIRSNDIQGTIEYIGETIKEYSPEYPFEYSFFDEIFNRAYTTEQRTGRIFAVFSVIAILIGCMGLFGLIMFTTEQKTKEIGIRKILGSSVSGIILLLSKEFSKWIIIANIIAWPVGYLFMSSWLQNFAYHFELQPGLFILSGTLTFLIACAAIGWQSLKAATVNPVKSLRYE
ncbi:ABC transporter permease [candidate division KSB1 bacterium]